MSEPVILVNKKNLPTLKRDFLTVNKMRISDNNDFVFLRITYHGGCKEHTFRLYGFYEDDRNLVLLLEHNAHGDQCKMIIEKDLTFDLSLIRKYCAIEKKKTTFSSLRLKMGKLEAEYSYSQPPVGKPTC
jgi:hypothetical protein